MNSLVRAPSNIALIKYMGKKDLPGNIPENPSVSVTLDALCTYAEIRRAPVQPGQSAHDETETWIPELPALPAGQFRLTPQPPKLSPSGAERALNQLRRVREACPELFSRFGIPLDTSLSRWELRTANTFPAASGIASSASSFAAITIATALACSRDRQSFEKVWKTADFKQALARLARAGSGSSCRSLDGPWVLWENEDARKLDSSRIPELAHFVLLVSETEKSVSSSQAHARVKTSPLWDGRVSRVRAKLVELSAALQSGDLDTIARLAWRESWEMHSLFHTAEEPFSYWSADTISLLQWLAPSIAADKPPIVTLDAGPNVHLLVRSAEASSWEERLRSAFPAIRYLRDRPGTGAALL